MKIWLVNHYAGVRQIAFGKEMEKRGHEVLIWRSNFRNSLGSFYGKKHLLWHNRTQSGLPFRIIATCGYRRNDYRRALNMLFFTINFAVVSLFSQKPDIILGSSPHLLAAWMACMVAKLFRIPFVAEIRDLWPDSLIQMGAFRSPFIIKPLSWMEKSLYKNSKYILALSHGIQKGILDKGIDNKKIIFLPNGIYPTEVPKVAPSDKWRQELNLTDQFICLYSGAFGPANDLQTAVKAAKILEDKGVSMVLLGEGAERENLIRLTKELNCTNVYFIPWVERQETFAYMMNSDVLLLSLLQDIPVFEGVIPNKLLNYLACGRPIICAVKGEAADILKEANSGMAIPPSNPEVLAKTILWLKESPSQCKKLSEQGRAYVEANFNRDKLSVKFADLAESILKSLR